MSDREAYEYAVATACGLLNIDVGGAMSTRRKADFCLARKCAYHALYRFRWTHGRIAGAAGKDRTTVLHALSALEDRDLCLRAAKRIFATLKERGLVYGAN